MPNVSVYNMKGAVVGQMALSETTFAAEVNEHVMHLVVRAQLNAKRQGTQSALTRAEVSGGGKKPWRQKGTGRARVGSSRNPVWKHGGVAFAPKPRDYYISVPRKVRRLALKGALTSKVEEGNLLVLDSLKLDAPKTKLMATVLKALNVDKKALLVLHERDESLIRASGNIPNLKTAYVNTLNVLDILNHDKFIITQDAVKLVEEVYV